jgi:hypothetical protein
VLAPRLRQRLCRALGSRRHAVLRAILAGTAWGLSLAAWFIGLAAWHDGGVCVPHALSVAAESVTLGNATIGLFTALSGPQGFLIASAPPTRL